MSISTHINEYISVFNFLLDVSAYNDTDIESVGRFLHGIYPDDSGDEDEYDMDKGLDDPQFTIKVIDNSIDEYLEVNYLKVHLPSRKDADELADLLNGTVTYDGSKPKKAKKCKTLYIVSVATHAKNARTLVATKGKHPKLWVLPPTVHHTLEEAQKYFDSAVESYTGQPNFVKVHEDPTDTQYKVIELTDQICTVRLTEDTPED